MCSNPRFRLEPTRLPLRLAPIIWAAEPRPTIATRKASINTGVSSRGEKELSASLLCWEERRPF